MKNIMEKNIQQEKDKEKPVFYDPKGRRNIAFIWFLCISIVSVSVVFSEGKQYLFYNKNGETLC
ncbi:hypothetical protein QUF96_06965 [Bacillus bombysepticus]|nr:hypothetical protein [Bacillus bombysepticus]